MNAQSRVRKLVDRLHVGSSLVLRQGSKSPPPIFKNTPLLGVNFVVFNSAIQPQAVGSSYCLASCLFIAVMCWRNASKS